MAQAARACQSEKATPAENPPWRATTPQTRKACAGTHEMSTRLATHRRQYKERRIPPPLDINVRVFEIVTSEGAALTPQSRRALQAYLERRSS